MTLTAKRENGLVRIKGLDYDLPANGFWIVRDEIGQVIDRDQYRNDLRDRYPGLIVIGD